MEGVAGGRAKPGSSTVAWEGDRDQRHGAPRALGLGSEGPAHRNVRGARDPRASPAPETGLACAGRPDVGWVVGSRAGEEAHPGMRTSVALLAHGMRWRLGMSLLTVLTSAIAVGAAVLGPLYLWTAGDSVVRTTLNAAAISDRGVTLAGPAGQRVSLTRIERAERTVDGLGGRERWYGKPITSAFSSVRLVGPGRSPLSSLLLWRSGICTRLRFSQGSCDLGFGDVVLSQRSARELGVGVGATIDARASARSRALLLRVTGIYAVPDLSAPYWWNQGRADFAFGNAQRVGSATIPELDALIASPATVSASPAAPDVLGQVPLRLGQVGLADQADLSQAVSRASATLRRRGVVLSSGVTALLAGATRQRHQMATIVIVAAVELVVLAVWILASLLLRSSEARLPEIRVARLRGFPAVTLLAVTVTEPAILCLLGIVLGLVGAWITMIVARDRLLDPAATISPSIWAFAALLLAAGSIAATLLLGTFRLLRSSGVSAGRPVDPRRTQTLSVAADAILLVLAIVALIALATSGALAGHEDPIASAAPGLIALGVAVIAVNVVLLACRLAVSISANSSRVGVFLATRQIARRPALLRQARVLIITVGLACFATSAWAVARSNRTTSADFRVGSPELATVTPSGDDLEQAVARVDPRGRFAMAAVVVNTSSSTVLAVDARRLRAAVTWPAGVSRATLGAVSLAINPRVAPQVNLTGTAVVVTARTSGSGPVARRLGNLKLGLWLSDSLGTSIVELGPLHAGAGSYRAPLTGSCAGGCRLAGIGILPVSGRALPSSGSATIVVQRLAEQVPSRRLQEVAADRAPHDWRASASGAVVSAGPNGIALTVPVTTLYSYTSSALSSAPPMVAPADHPAELPVVATSAIEELNGSSLGGTPIPVQGLDGTTLNVVPRITASALPSVGGDAVMVDLNLLERSEVNATTGDVTDEVWLGPAAPPDSLARLQAAGLHIDSVQRASTLVRQMQQSGPALADDFLLLATIIALIAGALSTLSMLGATARQRATELTALEVSGVRRPTLIGALSLETIVLATTGLFGMGAGALAAAMTVPSLPELADAPLYRLSYALPGALIVAVSGLVTVIVLLVGSGTAIALTRRMSPLLLRTAPDDSIG
jgi:putative ABC transport system permease protein